MPVVDDQGTVVFICAEGQDITQKKAQEREIAAKKAELCATVLLPEVANVFSN